MEDGKKADDDDRPPICPACGVTMGITVDEEGSTRYVCLECGFSDDPSKGLQAVSVLALQDLAMAKAAFAKVSKARPVDAGPLDQAAIHQSVGGRPNAGNSA